MAIQQLASTDRNPVQETQYQNELRAAGIDFTVGADGKAIVEGFGAGGNETSAQADLYFNPAAMARRAAIQPAIKSLQASKPEATNIYTGRQAALEGERQPTLDRYANLIDEIRGNQAKEEASITKDINRNYAQRGFDTSSGLVGEQVTRGVADSNRYYTGQIKDTTFAQEADIRDLDNMLNELTNSHVQTLRQIDNQIAMLQADSANQGITDALQILRDEENREFESRFDALEKEYKQAQIASATGSSKYELVNENNKFGYFDPKTGAFNPYGATAGLKAQTGGDPLKIRSKN